MVKRIKYKIAIRGGKNKEEGQKVIEILTLLGGKNEENLDGSFGENKLYIIGKGLKIDFVDYPVPETLSVKYKLYTAKEFFLKFPYRVDDWVECKDGNLTGQVTSLFWNEDEGCVVYQVSFGGGVDYGFYKEVMLKPTIVREVMNVASVLKECPRGMELYSSICTDLYFDFVDDLGKIHCYIQRKNHRTGISFYPNGTLHNDPQDKCVIFPRNRTSWEGFQGPFKDGDILVSRSNQPFIFEKLNNKNGCFSHCGIARRGEFCLASDDWTFADSLRFATEEEKERLFKTIEDNGFRWNTETKTLEILIVPRFKVGDWIKHKLTGEVYRILSVLLNGCGGGVYNVVITNEIGKSIDIKEQGNYELVTMKKKYKVKDLITYLLDFNMEAEVLVNASGVPEEFDISWSDGGDSPDPSVINSKKRADTVCFNVICGEK